MTGLLALWLLAAGSTGAQGRVPSELDGAIVGRVCEDLDGDGVCAPGEPGIAHARLVLETGQETFTDELGRYHFAALQARVPNENDGGRLLWGRHRIRLDPRALFGGARPQPSAATVELSMGALARQDFAVASPRTKVPKLSVKASAPPAAKIEKERVRFLLSGHAAPGAEVTLDGQRAEVAKDGAYQGWVSLANGENQVAITVRSPEGTEQLFRQQVDVVPQGESLLVVPRKPTPVAMLHLPAKAKERAEAGRTTLRIEGAPGTKIVGPEGEVTVRENGVAEVPVELSPGSNQVPLTIAPPGQPAQKSNLSIAAAARPFAVGLLDLDLEYDTDTKGVRLFGRGAAHGEMQLGDWAIAGEVSLNDLDVKAANALGVNVLGYPRLPEAAQRALDPDRYPLTFGDASVTSMPNPSEGRLRLSIKHPKYGELAFGTVRAELEDQEVGRYHREVFGPSLDLKLPAGPVKLSLRAFDGSGLFDPTRGLATAPVHDELAATGGSLYYLHEGAVSEGSEVVTVEWREGISGVPLAQGHLVRGRDYEIDYTAGRILLREPLSYWAASSTLPSEALGEEVTQVLVVDAERLTFSDSEPALYGGELKGELGPVALRIGGINVHEPGGFKLLRGSVGVPLGPLTLWVEGAASRHVALGSGDLALSDDGGLSFLSAPLIADDRGEALTVRLKGPSPLEGGQVDVSFRRRTPGFSDGAHLEVTGSRQLFARIDQPIGAFRIGVKADDFRGDDPRNPFSGVAIDSRVLGGSVGWHGGPWGVDLDVKEASLTAPPEEGAPVALSGGRTSVGGEVRYRLNPKVTLLASDQQVVSQRGSGPGADDDSFAKAGVEVNLAKSDYRLEAGWGPHLGPQILGGASVKDGGDTYYGSYSVDTDGPDVGTARSVSGASTRIADGTSVFVEDVAAHDANSFRLSKAVGLSGTVTPGLTLSARYERGARSLLLAIPTFRRDAAAASVQWVGSWLRAYARGEVRFDRGREELGPPVEIHRTQRLLSGALEALISPELTASARVNFGDSYDFERRESRFLEGGAAIAWTRDPFAVIARYSATRELLPPPNGTVERTLQIFSLLPAVKLGDRLSISAGGHAALDQESGTSRWIFSGSVRPAVRVVGGLELAAEVAGRTAALDGGSLHALRGEVGYRFGEHALIAAGYSIFGFSGIGLSPGPDTQEDRLYLRAELGI